MTVGLLDLGDETNFLTEMYSFTFYGVSILMATKMRAMFFVW